MLRITLCAAAYCLGAWLLGFWPFEEEGLLTGPASNCSYDAGYDDGYDGAARRCRIDVYVQGYEDGDFDSECQWLRCEMPDYDEFERIGCRSWSEMTCE